MRKTIGILFIVAAMLAATPMTVELFSHQANQDALKFYRSLTMFFAWENVCILAAIGLVILFWDDLNKSQQ